MSVDRFIDLSEMKGSPLEDFPRTEHWRIMADGWQHHFGINHFRPAYYKGVQEGYAFIAKHAEQRKKITPDFIQKIFAKDYQFEDDFQNLKQMLSANGSGHIGFRGKALSNGFLVAPTKSTNTDGASTDGLDDFITAALQANKDGRWKLVVASKSVIYQKDAAAIQEFVDQTPGIDLSEFANDKNKLKERLELILKNLDKNNYLYIVTFSMPLNRVFQFIQKVLDEFYEKMDKLNSRAFFEKNQQKIADEKIAAIVKLIQTLNQDHWLPDGNGRTLLILQNFLLMQHLQCMTMMMTPAHLTGFSTRELVEEVKNGIARLNEFKITKAKKFLQNLTVNDIEDEGEIIAALNKNLSSDNIAALAQINELFLQIQENKICVPKDFKEAENDEPKKAAHEKILNILQDLYLDKLQRFAENPPARYLAMANNEKLLTECLDRFNFWLHTHEICKSIDRVDKRTVKSKLMLLVELHLKAPDVALNEFGDTIPTFHF